MYFTIHFLGQIGMQIRSLGRQQGTIQRIHAVCLRYYADHRADLGDSQLSWLTNITA